jgi:predicted adenine nucleotide alpha hydrolase (AANH) superfamily ATPase
VEALREEDIRPDILWYNPNIHPFTEYTARRDTLFRFARDQGLETAEDGEYGLRPFLAAVYPDLPNRCALCYRIRLEKTARRAAERGYDGFSSTLLISPYQKHDLIRQTGEDLAERFSVPFVYRDFRPRFRRGQAAAREGGFYMQKYCGCIFSEEERYR